MRVETKKGGGQIRKYLLKGGLSEMVSLQPGLRPTGEEGCRRVARFFEEKGRPKYAESSLGGQDKKRRRGTLISIATGKRDGTQASVSQSFGGPHKGGSLRGETENCNILQRLVKLKPGKGGWVAIF